MNILLATALLSSLGSGSFEVDPPSTTIDYRQNNLSLTVEGTDFIGGTLGGYFASHQNWENVEHLGLRASVQGANPNSYFLVEFYSGESLDLVGVYQATTDTLPGFGTVGEIDLYLVQSGPGNPADIRGMQFTWGGEGFPVELSMYSLVDMSALVPEITSYGFSPQGFTIQWVGTGSRPVNVERTTDLKTGPWVTVATGVTSREFTDTTTPAGRAFYKVVVP